MDKPIKIIGGTDVVLRGLKIHSKDLAMHLRNVRGLLIEDCEIVGANRRGVQNLYIKECENIIIRGNILKKGGHGMQLWFCGDNIEIQGNLVEDFGVRLEDSKRRDANGIQLCHTKARGVDIHSNTIQTSVHNFSMHNDCINLYNSFGYSDNRMKVENNHIQTSGFYHRDSGGIVIGDSDGGFVDVLDNTLIRPASYGIGLSKGGNYLIKGNKVYIPQEYQGEYYGQEMNKSNVGLYCFTHNTKVVKNHFTGIRYDGVKNDTYTSKAGENFEMRDNIRGQLWYTNQ